MNKAAQEECKRYELQYAAHAHFERFRNYGEEEEMEREKRCG